MASDGSLIFDTKIDTKGIDSGLKDIESKASGFTIGKGIMSSLAADAIKAAGGALVDAAQAGIEFEASMSRVEAVSGATGQQLESLTDLAREYGASTVFSSSECADALNYMAMAGWNAEQMTNGLPGVLNLAAASGEDLAATSDIVTDALTAFGMQAEEAGHFADILATASSKSNTNVSMMGETFKYVAPVAGALGYSAEDVAVAVGLMANSGIKASQAGTSLRTILSNLTEPTDKQAAAMDTLGISLTDSSGKMKTLDALLGNMRSAFAGLDEAQKASYASIIAGQEGMSGLLAVVNAADSDFSNLKSAIYDCDGACSDMADTMTDNVSGSLKELSSAAEDAQIELYDAVKPMIEDAIPGVKGFFSWIKSNAGTIANLLKPIGGALQVILSVLKPIGDILSPVLGLVGKITGAIGDALSWIGKSSAEIEDYNGTMKECQAEIEATANTLRSAQDEFGENSEEAQELEEKLTLLNAQFAKGGGEAQIYADEVTELSSAFETLKNTQDETMQSIDSSEESGLRAISMLQKLSEKTSITTADLDMMSEYADYLNDTFNCNIKVNYDTGELTGFDPDYLVKQVQNRINENRRSAAFDFITSEEFSGGYIDAAKKLIDEQNRLSNMQHEFDAVAAERARLIQSGEGDKLDLARRYDYLSEQIPKAGEELKKHEAVMNDMNSQLETNGKLAGLDAESIGVLRDSMVESVRTGQDFISVEQQQNDALTEQQQGADAAKSIMEQYTDKILAVAEAYDAARQAAYDSMSQQFGMFDIAQTDADATVSAFTAAGNSQVEFWNQYNSNLQKLREMSAESLGVTKENFQLLMDLALKGDQESVSLLNDAMAQGESGLAQLANTLGAVEEAKSETAKTAGEIDSGLNEAMDKIKQDIANDVDELDMSEEAKTSAVSTMNGYIDGITNSVNSAAQAAQSVVDAVKAVFSSSNLTFTASGVSGSVQIEGNAGGTTNSSDVFIAGEEGPELIVGKKGSTVFPFSETAKIVSAVNSLAPAAMPSASALYSSLLSPTSFSSRYSTSEGSSGSAQHSPPSSVSQFSPSFAIYIGDEEIRNFVIDTITDENANSGGFSI